MSNFDFLKDYDKDLWKTGNRIEEQLNISPQGAKSDATPFLERVLTILMEKIDKKYNPRKEFYYQLDAVYREGIISYRYKASIYDAYQLRNRIHDTVDVIEKTEVPIAHQLHKKLFYIAKKLYRDFNPNYDDYKGVPQYKPVEIDTSMDEVDMIEIPDFSEIIEVNYDYCVICGEPNHSNFSLCCYKCNRVMDNANNFISMRNTFGKNAKFTKEDLIEYGIPEGYANQLINSLVQDDMLKVKGRYITFNNMHMDEYLSKIDKYIAVCELITKFKEDKITPGDIKQTREYKQGSFKQEPFYQFFKLVNREIVKKFEKYLLVTQDIDKSMEYTTISQKQLQRWYNLCLSDYKKGKVNESFMDFNTLLMEEYLDLKREGLPEKDIKKQLNVSDEVYNFWLMINPEFEDKVSLIKIELISKAISEGKTKGDIIEFAGLTAKEYDDIVKVAKFKNNELAQLREKEIDERKKNFVKYLKDNDLETACSLAKFTVDDFYEYYDEANQSSDFFIESTRLLMDKYLDERRKGKSKCESIADSGIKEEYLKRWNSRTIYHDFKNEDLKITVDLILSELKDGKTLEEASVYADVDVNATKRFIRTGERGSEIYKPLYEYYESEMLPQKLSKFLETSKSKSIRKSLEIADLTEKEAEKYYQMGKNGDERYNEFYEGFLNIKKGIYVYHKQRKKSHKIAMRESMLTQEEYELYKDDLDELLQLIKFKIVIEEIRNKKTSNVAASKANCSVDDIYEWYFKGRDGEEQFVQFYEVFHAAYVRPNINTIQEHLDYKNQSLENIVRANKDQITKKDVKIWVEHGLLDNKILKLANNKDDDDSDNESKFNANEMLREMGVEDYDKIKIKKSTNSSSILTNNDDEEELKKQILKKG
nr:PHD finger domain-containing protein [uncultured Methanobrevibacter sp.]